MPGPQASQAHDRWQLTPNAHLTGPFSRGQSLAKLQPHSETQDKARAGILAVAERKERPLGWAQVQGQS